MASIAGAERDALDEWAAKRGMSRSEAGRAAVQMLTGVEASEPEKPENQEALISP